MIAVDLSKQQSFDVDINTIQQNKFSGNLKQREIATMFFITEEAKETILNFFTRCCESIVNLFCSNKYQYNVNQYNTLNLK